MANPTQHCGASAPCGHKKAVSRDVTLKGCEQFFDRVVPPAGWEVWPEQSAVALSFTVASRDRQPSEEHRTPLGLASVAPVLCGLPMESWEAAAGSNSPPSSPQSKATVQSRWECTLQCCLCLLQCGVRHHSMRHFGSGGLLVLTA